MYGLTDIVWYKNKQIFWMKIKGAVTLAKATLSIITLNKIMLSFSTIVTLKLQTCILATIHLHSILILDIQAMPN